MKTFAYKAKKNNNYIGKSVPLIPQHYSLILFISA